MLVDRSPGLRRPAYMESRPFHEHSIRSAAGKQRKRLHVRSVSPNDSINLTVQGHCFGARSKPFRARPPRSVRDGGSIPACSLRMRRASWITAGLLKQMWLP